jgi:RimJ/RimL family protein N-acetyltransferase
MTKRLPGPARALDDGRITVRRPTAADVCALAAHRDDPDAPAWLSARSTPFEPATLLAEYLAGWWDERNRLGVTLVVEEGSAATFRGVVHLYAAGSTLTLAYGVAPEARGRGVATAACRLICDWAFDHDFEQVQVEIAVDNEASRRVAEACGFREERRLRVPVEGTGEVHDAAILVRRKPAPVDG